MWWYWDNCGYYQKSVMEHKFEEHLAEKPDKISAEPKDKFESRVNN